MTIIESLKKLGKSLLGDNYTPTEAKTDSQIAETIEGISKAIDDAGGIGGGSGSGIEIKLKYDINAVPSDPPTIIDPLPTGLSVSDFSNTTIMMYMGENLLGFTKATMVSMGVESILITIFSYGKSGIEPMSFTYNPATGEVGISQIGLGDEMGQLV